MVNVWPSKQVSSKAVYCHPVPFIASASIHHRLIIATFQLYIASVYIHRKLIIATSLLTGEHIWLT